MPEITLIFGEDGVVRWKPAGNASGGRSSGKKFNWIDGPSCPIHGAWKVVPGGYSQKTQRDYDPFYVCQDDHCPNRPGRDWTAQNPPATDDAPWPGDDDLDPLPF